MARIICVLCFIGFLTNAHAIEDCHQLVELLDNAKSSTYLNLRGNLEMITQDGQTKTPFKAVKSGTYSFYEDNSRVIIVKPEYSVWIDHAGKFIIVSLKHDNKNIISKSPIDFSGFIKSSIRMCEVKFNALGVLSYDVKYSDKTDFDSSHIEFNSNKMPVSVYVKYASSSYVKEQWIYFNDVNTDEVKADIDAERKYIEYIAGKWNLKKDYINYKLQII